MSDARRGERFWTLRRRVAAAALILGAVGYPIAWNVDPYVYGFFVLGLGTLQGAIGALGIVARVARLDRSETHVAVAWVVDVLLIVSAVIAFAVLDTISWT